MKKTTCFSFLLVILFASADLHASGFAVFSQGAASFGRAGASIARLDSPSAVFYNPALISKLDGTQMELGTTAVRLVFEQKSDLTGETATTDSDLFFPSTLYATHGVNEQISFGIGVFSPFGLATQWGKTWEGRYLATDSELSTVCVNPVISVAVTPNLSIAGGVNYLDLDTSLENNINLSGYGLGDGEQKFDGDGSDYGFTLGLAWAVTQRVHLGLSYRSGYSVDLDGSVTFDLPAGTPAAIAQALPDTGAKATLDLPEEAFASIAFQVTGDLMVETGILWEGWSDYDTIESRFDRPVFGSTTDIMVKEWKDTLTYNLGLEYLYSDDLTLRTGYLYREGAVPDHTFDPSLPDADAHLLALGGDYGWGRYTLSLAYVYEWQEERDKETNLGADLGGTANGRYNSDIHFLAASLKMKF